MTDGKLALYDSHALHPFVASTIEDGQCGMNLERPVPLRWFCVKGRGTLMLPDWHDIYLFWLSTRVSDIWHYWYVYNRPFDPLKLALSPLLNTLIASGAQVVLAVTPTDVVYTLAWTAKQEPQPS